MEKEFTAQDARDLARPLDDSYKKAIEEVKSWAGNGNVKAVCDFELSTETQEKLKSLGYKLGRESNPNNIYRDYWTIAW